MAPARPVQTATPTPAAGSPAPSVSPASAAPGVDVVVGDAAAAAAVPVGEGPDVAMNGGPDPVGGPGTAEIARARQSPIPRDLPPEEAYDRLAELLHYSHTILFTLDRDLRITYISEVLGMPREAVTGRRFAEVIAADEAEVMDQVAREAFRTGEPLDFEASVRWLDVPRVYATRVVPVRQGDEIDHLAIAITDVSEVRRVEQRERDTEAALALALAETGTRAVGLDLDGRILWVAGMPPAWSSRLVGHRVPDLWPDAAADEERARTSLLAGATRVSFDVEVEIGGEPTVQRAVMGVVHDAAGTVTGFVITATDVTELRRQADRAEVKAHALEEAVAERTAELAASEERLRVSMDATLDTLGIMRAVRDGRGRITDFRIEYANPAWIRVYGGGVANPAGLHLYRDFPFFRARRDVHIRAVLDGEPVRATLPVPLGDGVRLYDFQLTPFPDGFVVASRDVTDQVEAERRVLDSERHLRDLIAGVDAVVWEEDLATGRIWVSPQAEALIGYRPEAWVEDPDLWRRIVVPEDRDRVVAALDGDESVDVEYTLVRADGVARRVRDRMTVVKDEDGRLVRRYGLMIDVTALRQLEARAFSAERLDALGRFAGQVAHDVDNVIYGVGIFARYARQAALEGGDPVPDLDRVIDGLERGSSLTKGLLDFARSRPSRPTRIDLVPVVRGFLPILERLADPSIALEVHTHPDPVVVLADRAAIEQVLLNLATNALQAMASGGRLTIRLAPVRLTAEQAKAHGVRRGRYAELAVADTGAGMDAATLARIWEPFFSTREDGTGLGLPSVFAIVHTHKGVVDVTSRPGGGTRFRVLLPLVPVPVEGRRG